MRYANKLGAALSLVALLALGACGGDPVKDIDNLVNEACECKDMACVEGVNKKFEQLVEKYKDNKEPSKEDQEKIMKSMARLAECMTQIQTAEATGGAAPAAGTPPAPAATAGE